MSRLSESVVDLTILGNGSTDQESGFLAKLGAFFESCSESFITEGQAHAMIRQKRTESQTKQG